MKCKHEKVEDYQFYPGRNGKGVACSDCHAVMVSNAKGSQFLSRQRVNVLALKPIPLERKYWKEFVNRLPDPMSYESRMRGYDNIHMARH